MPALTGVLRALALAGALALAAPAQAQIVQMSRADGLQLARGLYLEGNAAMANAIARRLVEADPNDVEALLLLSASTEALGDPAAALAYGRRAWEAARAASRPAALRHEIARQTAHAALSAGRVMAARRWLARAVRIAPGPAQAAQSRKDLEFVSAASPTSAALRFHLTPTSNINGGSVSGLFMVDDVVIGGLSGWSEAQPGVIAGASLDLETALGSDGRARIGLSLSESLPVLSPAAARANPGLDAGDLEQQSATLRLEQDLAIAGNPARLTLSASEAWTAGAAAGPALRAALDLSLPSRPGTSLAITATTERQWTTAQGGITDGFALSLESRTRIEPLAGTLQAGASLRVTMSDWVNTTYSGYDLSLGWAADKPIAGVNWSVLMTAGGARFDRFQPIGGGIEATSGRSDTALGLLLSLRPANALLFGLTPFATLSHNANRSNISRYTTQSSAVTLGLSQEF